MPCEIKEAREIKKDGVVDGYAILYHLCPTSAPEFDHEIWVSAESAPSLVAGEVPPDAVAIANAKATTAKSSASPPAVVQTVDPSVVGPVTL